MRVAAVAFVLIIGAAIVLAFANTLNSWVLGGLLGGLAAILLCIPISLAIFTLLSRRQEVRLRAAALAAESEAEVEGELVVMADEDELLADCVEDENEEFFESAEEDFSPAEYARFARARRHVPVSGYLDLPPVEENEEEDRDRQVRGEPRNYPLQPRRPARVQARVEESASSSLSPLTRRPATRSLAEHQSAALRQARLEARQQLTRRPNTSAALSRRPRNQNTRSSASRRPRGHGSAPLPVDDDYAAWQAERSAWSADEDFSTEELAERRQSYPRRPRSAYPRTSPTRQPDPWTAEFAESETEMGEQEHRGRSRRPRHDPDRVAGNIRHPLVRRAPYLYADDPLSEEFARQLDQDHPLTRRSSLYEYDGEREPD